MPSYPCKGAARLVLWEMEKCQLSLASDILLTSLVVPFPRGVTLYVIVNYGAGEGART